MREEKFFRGMLGQLSAKVKQFVFEGFATTNILAVTFAYFSNILALLIKIDFFKRSLITCYLKISLFILSRSDLSMPGLRGNPPKNIPTSMSLKATEGSAVTTTEVIKENAQSSICILIPFNSCNFSLKSSSFNWIETREPNTYPQPSNG